MGAQLHPDHRADLVFNQVLRSPIAGMDHAERTFLACAAYSRHTSSSQSSEPVLVARLLSAERQQRAQALGAALRLGCDLSGRSPELLACTRLEIRPDAVVLHIDEAWAPVLIVDQITKRGQTLASLLERTFKVRTIGAKSKRFANAI